MPVSVVLTTTPDARSARRLSELLIRNKAAACVSVLPGVTSVYRWKGMVERSRECLLVIKTDSKEYPRLEKTLRAIHPYETPEIVELPARRGLRSYVDWVRQSTR